MINANADADADADGACGQVGGPAATGGGASSSSVRGAIERLAETARRLVAAEYRDDVTLDEARCAS